FIIERTCSADILNSPGNGHCHRGEWLRRLKPEVSDRHSQPTDLGKLCNRRATAVFACKR
ncbi:hypothetical protein, partial [Pantoea septica]|uniref:hypothetical protein n=1 Tax=Pantoea septica TaxID=472695 RepID=UPI0023F90C99